MGKSLVSCFFLRHSVYTTYMHTGIAYSQLLYYFDYLCVNCVPFSVKFIAVYT